MKRFILHPTTLICLILIVIAATWLIILPTQLAGKLKQIVEMRTGRSFDIAGGSGYRFSPQWGLEVYDITFSGSSALAEPVLKSKVMFIPLSIGVLLGAVNAASPFTFSQADVTVAFNEQGHANLLINQNPEAGKTDVNAPEQLPVSVNIQSGTFHFSDARDGTSFVLPQFSGVFDFSADGGLVMVGSAEINDRHANFSGTAKSLPRAIEEGSPLDFNLDSEGHAFSFSGRLATTGALNLAGQATVETSDAQKLFHWLGVDFETLPENLKLSLDGPLESQGSTFAFKKSSLQIDNLRGSGDVLFSTPAGRKNLALQLDFESLPIKIGDSKAAWSEVPFDVAALQNFDAQFQISTPKLLMGLANLGGAKLEGTLKNAVFSASLKTASFNLSQLKLDAAQLSVALDVTLSTINADAKTLLAALTGQNKLSGAMTLTTSIKAQGKSQAEMVSTLSGDVDATFEKGAFATNIGTTEFKQMAAHASLQDGIATLADTHFTIADQVVNATGEVDLLRKTLSISAEPIAQQKILLDGAWNDPKISAIAPTLH